MFDLDKWQEIFSSLSKNPLRTTLTAIGVFWGIFMLVIMLGAGKGLQNVAQQGFAGIATNSVFIWAQSTSKPYKGFGAGRRIRMNNDDYLSLQRTATSAKIISPRNQLGGFRSGNTVTRGKESASFNVMGDYPAIKNIESVQVLEGRFINPIDIEDRRKTAVIGSRVREVLFDEEEDPIGESIKINGVYFKVIGVFGTRQSGERGLRETEKIYIPFTTFQQAFNFGNFISWFAVTAKEGVRASKVKDDIVSHLSYRHKVDPEDQRAFGNFDLEKIFNRIQSLFLGINIISWLVGSLTLVAGAIGVSNIMLIVVKERTKEIGIRRALGAKPIAIVGQIIQESIVLTFTAGLVGLMFGVLVLEVVGNVLPEDGVALSDPSVKFQTAIIALFIIVLSGAFAGLIPAQRAVSISPVNALRSE